MEKKPLYFPLLPLNYQILREKDSEIKFGKVNGPEEEELLEKMHVTGYPTLFFYREGLEPIKYTGGRMANEIAGWVEKKTGPPAVPLADAAAVKEFVDDAEVAVVGFFKDQDSKEAKAYLETVRDFEDYPCGITSDEEAFTAREAKDGEVRESFGKMKFLFLLFLFFSVGDSVQEV